MLQTPVSLELGGASEHYRFFTPAAVGGQGKAIEYFAEGQNFRLVPAPLPQVYSELVSIQNYDARFSMQNSDVTEKFQIAEISAGVLSNIYNIPAQDIDFAPITDGKSAEFSRWPPSPAAPFFTFYAADLSAEKTVPDTLPFISSKPSFVALQSLSAETSGNVTKIETGQLKEFTDIRRSLAIDVQVRAVNQFTVKIVDANARVPGALPMSDHMPGQPAFMISKSPAGMTASVLGSTPENFPVILMNWPDTSLLQTFVLQTPVENVQPGTELDLMPRGEPFGFQQIQGTEVPMQAMLTELMRPSYWPELEQLVQTVSQQNPQAAQAFARVLPSTANPGQLGPAALLFLAAVRSGDLGSWLGERAINALKRADKGNVLGKLRGQLSGLNRVQAETVSQDWRGFALPLAHQGEIHKAAFYYRHGQGGEKDDEEGGDKPTRFIFDLSLSRMGEVQIDGLVRGRRLDLVVRTQARMSMDMQREMRKVYAGAMSQTGYEGDISFQDDPDRWVRVIKEDKVIAFGS
jgi:hypothetical protein